MKLNKQRRKWRGALVSLIFGIVFSALSLLALALISSLVLTTLKNPLGAVGICALPVLVLSGAISSLCTAKFKGSGGTGTAIISSLLFATILLFTGIIINGGHLPLLTMINLAVYLLVSVFISALTPRKSRKSKIRR